MCEEDSWVTLKCCRTQLQLTSSPARLLPDNNRSCDWSRRQTNFKWLGWEPRTSDSICSYRCLVTPAAASKRRFHHPRWNGAVRKQKQVLRKSLVGVCASNYPLLSTSLMSAFWITPPIQPRDTHMQKKRHALLFCSCILRMLTMLWCPSSPPLPSLFSVVLPVSWELIYVWFQSQHARLDLASFSFPLHPSVLASLAPPPVLGLL